MKLILASSSPRRSEILEMMNLEFVVMISRFDEKAYVKGLNDSSPAGLVKALSREKSDAVAREMESGFVLGADTVVVLDDCIYGKPADDEELRHMMKQFSSRTHQVMTGVTVTNAMTGAQASAVAVTDVTFRDITPKELDWYTQNAHYRDKAGGYAIQEHAALFITGIKGCYYNVVGLPVQETLRLLTQLGLDWKEFIKKG